MVSGGQERGKTGRVAAAKTMPQGPRRRRRRRRRQPPPKPMSIRAVCRAAAKEGVSYGIYVLRHGV